MTPPSAVLLIAHGSRRPAANHDAVLLAQKIADRGNYEIVEVAYLELAEPGIPTGGARCVERGAQRVQLMPYFLSAGVHVATDLQEHLAGLQAAFPAVTFELCEPLGQHPLLIDIVLDRLQATSPAPAALPLM